MLNWLKNTLSKSIWHTLAMIIIMLVAGPEIMISMELMAIVEVLGASTFVAMYFSGLKLFICNCWDKFKTFESHSFFFIPSFDALKQMPSLFIHAIPERTIVIAYLCVLIGCTLCLYINIAFPTTTC